MGRCGEARGRVGGCKGARGRCACASARRGGGREEVCGGRCSGSVEALDGQRKQRGGNGDRAAGRLAPGRNDCLPLFADPFHQRGKGCGERAKTLREAHGLGGALEADRHLSREVAAGQFGQIVLRGGLGRAQDPQDETADEAAAAAGALRKIGQRQQPRHNAPQRLPVHLPAHPGLLSALSMGRGAKCGIDFVRGRVIWVCRGCGFGWVSAGDGLVFRADARASR